MGITLKKEVVGIFIYERAHVSFHLDENGIAVSIIGGAEGPTSVFIAGKLGGENMMTYKKISMDEAKQIFESRSWFLLPNYIL